MTLLSIGTAVTVLFHVAAAGGFLPAVYPGYLPASFSERYGADQRRLAANAVIEDAIKLCKEDDEDLRVSYAQSVQLSIETYTENGGELRNLRIPRCAREVVEDEFRP